MVRKVLLEDFFMFSLYLRQGIFQKSLDDWISHLDIKIEDFDQTDNKFQVFLHVVS